MARSKVMVIGAFLFAGLTGCGNTARYVASAPNGGIIAIPANSDEWPTHYRRDAEKLMQAKCPQGYVIDHEEEVSVGTVTTHQTKADPDPVKGILLGQKVDATEVHDQKEWHIAFHGKEPPVMAPMTPRAAVTPGSQNLPSSPVPVGN